MQFFFFLLLNKIDEVNNKHRLRVTRD